MVILIDVWARVLGFGFKKLTLILSDDFLKPF